MSELILAYEHWRTQPLSDLVKISDRICRNSGGSYLNRVELQNGCLALGHANLFIPSTLGGSCVDSATGKIDEKKLKHNMDLAMDVYLSQVDSPCGETTIRLFKGADSSERQRIRPYLIQFLKGSNIIITALLCGIVMTDLSNNIKIGYA